MTLPGGRTYFSSVQAPVAGEIRRHRYTILQPFSFSFLLDVFFFLLLYLPPPPQLILIILIYTINFLMFCSTVCTYSISAGIVLFCFSSWASLHITHTLHTAVQYEPFHTKRKKSRKKKNKYDNSSNSIIHLRFRRAPFFFSMLPGVFQSQFFSPLRTNTIHYFAPLMELTSSRIKCMVYVSTIRT